MKGFWKKKLPACLLSLALLMGTVPMASAAWADLTYDVDEDDYVFIGADDFEDLFDEEWDGWDSFEYLEFRNIDDFDDYGYFTAEDGDGYNAQLDSDDLYDGIFYSNGRDAEDWDEYDLDTLYFETYDNIDSDTIYIDFTLYGYDEDVDGTMCIDIAGGSGSSGDVELTYYVDPGDDVELDADDFWDLFDEESREDFEYLEFYSYDDFDDYGYFEAEDADGDWVQLYDSTLDDGYYYYNWYDTSSSYDYALDRMTFCADKNADEDTLEFPFTMYGDDNDEVDGTLYIEIGEGTGTSSKADFVYQVDPDDDVTLDAEDFYDFFYDESDYDELEYIEFTGYDDFDDYGYFGADGYDYDDYVRDYELNESDLDDGWFYYDEDEVWDDYEFELDTLTFYADRNADEDTLTFDITMHGIKGDKIDATLAIEIGEGTTSSATKVDGDIIYEVDPDDTVTFDRDDFWEFLDDETGDDLEYVRFTDATGLDDWGELYSYDYYNDRVYFDEGDLDDGYFYYDSKDLYYDDDCTLDDLTFLSYDDADGEVVYLDFTAYGRDDDAKGTVAIAIGDVGGVTAEGGDIRYYTDYSGRVQINANDIARFFEESYPGYTLQYVTLKGAPDYGSLYYNYYGTSEYGTSYSTRITADNCDDMDLYFSPSSSQYALSELTYVPSGVNYCAQIPFTAYGTGSRSVSGTILISVNLSEVPDVYGPTPKNTAVTFPAASIYTAVSQASGLGLSSIQLLELPAANEGTIYVGSGTSQRADTSTLYGYSSGSQRISQLRFVPATGFTGSVEIPYVACNSSGTPIASGKLCLGVVEEMEDFSDISSSAWCYKYVLELSDADVIDGYSDGTFKPDNQVTYGAALKLIMLAAGYTEQAPVNSNVFSGYLARAQADGLVSGSVDLDAPITRLAVSQIAAKAMGLSINNLSSVRPFTDTSDPYVQALNAAGIVEGYFDNGTSTFKPYNTLTRGQISAIVWRMEQYQ
ncbi:S-layer homology domain-containing protein [Oscillibacter valericigenes]|uniref:S-layer homology domain-containing protein n=1 Tax=Oscillibacter valericigenes TaxID=351091 RepID=UPI00195C7AF3|nr:S-layer homology domain-containing protein [Oscillibacter valericigenes]MBM6909308.1 S-layer homology domain-containing protein [Oscillibacter valericigenes]